MRLFFVTLHLHTSGKTRNHFETTETVLAESAEEAVAIMTADETQKGVVVYGHIVKDLGDQRIARRGYTRRRADCEIPAEIRVLTR